VQTVETGSQPPYSSTISTRSTGGQLTRGTMMGGHGILINHCFWFEIKDGGRGGGCSWYPSFKMQAKATYPHLSKAYRFARESKLQTWSKRNQSWTHLCTIRWWSTGPTPHRSFHDIQCFYEVSSKQLFARNNTLLPLVDKSWDHSPIICHSDLKTVEKILFLIELDRTLDCSNPVHYLILNKPMNGSCAISGILSTSV
jgi:hypothetical protein